MPATRATKLRPGSGRMVSAKSKTGDPLCSQAMSAFQLILRGATAAVSMTKEQASKILGQCRSKARLARKAQLAQSAGREALAQHLGKRAALSADQAISGPARSARARELLAVRAQRNAARAPEAARRLAEIRERNSAGKVVATIGAAGKNRAMAKRDAVYHVTPKYEGGDLQTLNDRIKSGKIQEWEAYRDTAKRYDWSTPHRFDEMTPEDWQAAMKADRSWKEYRKGEAKQVHFNATLREAVKFRNEFVPGGDIVAVPKSGLKLKKGAEYDHPVASRNIEAARVEVLRRARDRARKKAEPATSAGKPTTVSATKSAPAAPAAKEQARPAAKPATPATIGGEKPGEKFSLIQKKASTAPKIENLGKGRTPFMFDMKRGDKPGQLSIMDKVGTVDTRPLHAQALEAARKVPAHLRTGEKVFIHHAWQQYRKDGGKLTLDQFKRGLMESVEGRMMTSRADLVQGMRPGDVKGSRALWMGTEHNFIRTGQAGGSGPGPRENYWKPAPASEKARAAALVTKTRAARTKPAGRPKVQRARMAAAARDIHRATGRPMKSIDQAIGIARHKAAQARTAGDVVEAHRWNQHEAALQAHKFGGKAAKTGGWNRAPASERSAAAALVTKARSRSARNIQRRDLAPSGDRIEQLQRVPEKQAMGPRRSRTAAAVKDLRTRVRRFEDVATHGKAGDTGYVPTKALNFDPGRFQYKQAAQGKHGVTDQFRGTKKWNPELAGVISAWRDPADGRLYVVNGHHRADLAQRLGVDRLRVQLINARDAGEARAKGAIENIGEGRGTAYDAAKFLREQKLADRATLEEFGVSLSEAKAKQGLALAGLHPKLWKDYEGGALPEERAAMIGGSGLNHAQQESLAKSLKRGTSNATLRELIDNAHAAGKVKQQTRDLFGDSEEEVSLAHHRAAAQAHVRESLLADNRLYGLVSKAKSAASIEERGAGRIEQGKAGEISQQSRELLDVFDRLKNRSGPVAAALSEAQERLHAGHPKKAVYADLRKRVLAEMERVLRGGKEAFAA